MIPIFAGTDRREATRLRDAIQAAGLATELVDPNSGMTAQPGMVLSHVSSLDAALPRASTVFAFGGEDRALPALECIRRGATEYLPDGVDTTNAVEAIRAVLENQNPDADGIVAASDRTRAVFELARRVAQTDISVLIGGPSGSGKEVLARYIHQSSPRANGTFVAVNCAAIPETMLEAMLFGHEKGAFTGANDKRLGKFELADGGTLLLDEITEMPTSLQAKLLRVLQEREVERLGSHRIVKVDVRVIATSNRELSEAVEQGVLREDLYYRLSVFPLSLPALHERSEDILPLAEHFLAKHASGRQLSISAAAADALRAYPWPGNVRELENAMQRAIVLTNGREIGPDALSLEQVTTSAPAYSLGDKLRNAEDEVLLKALAANDGVRKATAEQLGISERTLRYKLKDLRERGLI
jgi:two-component system response regulator FlrC